MTWELRCTFFENTSQHWRVPSREHRSEVLKSSVENTSYWRVSWGTFTNDSTNLGAVLRWAHFKVKCLVERTSARKRVVVYRLTKKKNVKQAPIERRPNQFKFKIFQSDKFCTQIILFHRYTTTRKENPNFNDETKSLAENTSPEESREGLWLTFN